MYMVTTLTTNAKRQSSHDKLGKIQRQKNLSNHEKLQKT